MATKKVNYTVTQEDIDSKKFADKPELKVNDVIEIEVEDAQTAPPEPAKNTSGKKILYTITKEDVTNKKYPGKKAGDKIEIDAPENINTQTPDKRAKTDLDKKMESYKKYYPNEKTFYVTSDGQVFLAENKKLANEHQQILDESKAIIEYNV